MRIAAAFGMMRDKEAREPVVPAVDPNEKAKADQKKAKRRELGGDADRGLDTGEYEPFDDKKAPESGT
jgi:hypothetical protein